MQREADKYNTKPKSLKEKISNIWFHYKVQLIIGFFIIVIFAVMSSSLFQKKKYDLYVFYITDNPVIYTEKLNRIEAFLTEYAEDFDNNGKKTILVDNVYVGDESDNPTQIYKNKERIMTVLRSGDSMLIISDSIGTEYLYQAEAFEDLNGIVESEYYGGKAWLLNSSKTISEKLKLDENDHLYAGLRIFSGTLSELSDSATKKFEDAKTVLSKIVLEP